MFTAGTLALPVAYHITGAEVSMPSYINKVSAQGLPVVLKRKSRNSILKDMASGAEQSPITVIQ
ncbi:MAG: hypothetical protein J6I41_01955 [Bacteroidales bacterium]|nr:hypothetical protein [Bacteroidales bacterium]